MIKLKNISVNPFLMAGLQNIGDDEDDDDDDGGLFSKKKLIVLILIKNLYFHQIIKMMNLI